MRIVVGITGASGAIYADQLLSFLKKCGDHDVHIVSTPTGKRIFAEELKKTVSDFGFPSYHPTDFNTPFVSGSAKFDAMVVVPCSMGSLARIAHGFALDTLTRTADVFLKESRKLIIVPRETPFSLIHIENLKTLTLAGAHIIPANPSFYSHPKSIDQLCATVTCRILDSLGIENDLMERWKGG